MSDALEALEDVDSTVEINLDPHELVALEEAAELTGASPEEVAAGVVGDNIRPLLIKVERQKEKQKQKEQAAQMVQKLDSSASNN